MGNLFTMLGRQGGEQIVISEGSLWVFREVGRGLTGSGMGAVQRCREVPAATLCPATPLPDSSSVSFGCCAFHGIAIWAHCPSEKRARKIYSVRPPRSLSFMGLENARPTTRQGVSQGAGPFDL